MAKTRSSYRSKLLKRLSDHDYALYYLNAAWSEGKDTYLTALGDVAQAHQMAKVAKQAGVARESLYRSLSDTGNPTVDLLKSVWEVLDVDIRFVSAKRKISKRKQIGSAQKAIVGELINIGVIATGQMFLAFPEMMNLSSPLHKTAPAFGTLNPGAQRATSIGKIKPTASVPSFLAALQMSGSGATPAQL